VLFPATAYPHTQNEDFHLALFRTIQATLKKASLKAQKLFLSFQGAADQYQDTVGLWLHPGSPRDVIRPNIHVAPGQQVVSAA
jgi:hypothetical protein